MFSPDVRALAEFCQCNSLSLALADQIAFKLSKSAHDAQQQVRHRRVLSGKGKIFLLKPDMNAPLGKPEDELAEIIQVAGKPVHRVTNDGVPFPNVFHELLELGPVQVLARSLVSKPLVEIDSLKLAQLLLIESTHPQVADRLTSPALPFCHVRFFSLHHIVSRYQKSM